MEHFDLDLRELHQIMAIADEGSFARAARRLHISQPALSRSVQEAERKAGVRLFDRGRNGAVPTDAGWALLRHAETVSTAARDMQRELALIRGQGSGFLRVGAGVYPSELFLGQSLGKVLQQGKDIQVRFIGGGAKELLALLRKRELDLVVADPAWRENAADIEAEPLSEHQGYLVARAGHPLLCQKRPTLEDATAFPLVTSSLVPPRLAHLTPSRNTDAASEQALFTRWTPAVTTDSVTLMKETLMDSDAVTLLSLALVRKELEAGCLKIVPINLSWLRVSFAVMYLSHRTLSPLAEILIRVTRAVCKDLEAEEANLKKKWVSKR